MPDTAIAELKPLSRPQMAARVARDIPEGWYVNLGIGIPTAVADHVPLDREVIFHSENGVLGIGPAPPEAEIDRWLINAGKQYVTLRTGGRRGDGSGRGREAAVGDDGAHHQRRHGETGAQVQLSVDGAGCSEAGVYQPGGYRCDASRVRGC